MKTIKTLNRKKTNPFQQVFTGTKYTNETFVQLFTYNTDYCHEEPEYSLEKFQGFTDVNSRYWLNIHGIHDVEKITNLCNKLNIHNLVIQDILDVNQRPKFEEYEDYCFFTIKSVLPPNNNDVELEQLSFVLGKNFLLSLQEKKADYFGHVRHRLREKVGLLVQRTPDYLLYLLIESILDNYFKTLDEIEDLVDGVRAIDINTDPSPSLLQDIEKLKRQTALIKKTILPIKDFVSKIEHEEFDLIHDQHIKYFSELKDLCLTLIDNCDKIQMRLESSVNMFFSIQGHRMNQVMKTLTVVATIFIPLTFIAGIYGMNFSYIPELEWKWGYFGVVFIMVISTIGMLVYFKRKKWF